MSNPDLHSLLLQWTTLEPQRCRQQDDIHFEVRYLDHWLTITDQPVSHGNIIAAVLAGCQENQIYCTIDYTPRYENIAATIEVGCIPKMFRYRDGDEVISSIPTLLLMEYLSRLQRRSDNTEE